MLNVKEIEHIAKLARIELTAQEKEKFGKQLSDVLDYFEKLKEVKTQGIETADGGTRDLYNVWREDVIQETRNKKQDTKSLVDMAPEKEAGQVKVKKVL